MAHSKLYDLEILKKHFMDGGTIYEDGRHFFLFEDYIKKLYIQDDATIAREEDKNMYIEHRSSMSGARTTDFILKIDEDPHFGTDKTRINAEYETSIVLESLRDSWKKATSVCNNDKATIVKINCAACQDTKTIIGFSGNTRICFSCSEHKKETVETTPPKQGFLKRLMFSVLIFMGFKVGIH